MRFKPEEGNYVKKSVDASTTSIVLTSGPSAMLKLNPESDSLAQDNPDSVPSSFDIVFTKQSGLIPLTTSTFEVRASNDYSAGEWSGVSAYIGMERTCCLPLIHPCRVNAVPLFIPHTLGFF